MESTLNAIKTISLVLAAVFALTGCSGKNKKPPVIAPPSPGVITVPFTLEFTEPSENEGTDKPLIDLSHIDLMIDFGKGSQLGLRIQASSVRGGERRKVIVPIPISAVGITLVKIWGIAYDLSNNPSVVGIRKLIVFKDGIANKTSDL